jgi:hypothetical protein
MIHPWPKPSAHQETKPMGPFVPPVDKGIGLILLFQEVVSQSVSHPISHAFSQPPGLK